ncbi:MAG: hypothetical protein JO244_03015 [Solirubrobacterales bacterium]|nr:hypothetical protein [Solirubrobacterales bacterium]
MNLDFDPSVVSRFFRGVLTELHQKRLWPVALVLVAAIVAIPFVLSNSSSSTPQPEAQLPTPPPTGGSSIPALNVQTTPSNSHLRGASRNPFANSTSFKANTSSSSSLPVASGGSTATSPSVSGGGSTSSGGASGSSGASTGSGASGTSSVPTQPSSSVPSITHGATPKPAPSGLTKTQAYDVALAITDSSGGINTTDPLQRLTVIPSDQQPLLVELGVAQDGNHVLFAVQPGAVVTGPGSCTPGPIDCEILSLGQDQTEELSAQTGSLGASEVALFAITGISATDYSSASAANQARQDASSAGRALLAKSTSSALSLFQYEPSLGSVVDLRNLNVGG